MGILRSEKFNLGVSSARLNFVDFLRWLLTILIFVATEIFFIVENRFGLRPDGAEFFSSFGAVEYNVLREHAAQQVHQVNRLTLGLSCLPDVDQ